MSYTGSVPDFLADVKAKLFWPSQQITFTDQQILDIAYTELLSSCYPRIMRLREGYFSVFSTVDISSVRRYRIPKRAIGGKLYDIQIVDGDYTLSLNQVSRYDVTTREGYYIDGSDIVLTTNTRTSGTMKIVYPCRPYPFTATPSTKTVSAVPSATTVTASAAPAVSTADIQQTFSPFSIVAPDCAVSGSTLTVTSGANPIVGDTISNDGTTPYIPIPIECHDWLAIRTCMRILTYIGQDARVQLFSSKLTDAEAYIDTLMSPRTEGEEKVINDKETLGVRLW